MKARGLAKISQVTIKYAVQRYLRWCGFNNLDAETGHKEDLVAYLSHLRESRLKQRSIKSDFSYLSVWFSYLVEQGKLASNPIPNISKRYLKGYKAETPQRKMLKIEEAARMVQATLDSRDRCVLLLLLKTGIRRHELADLDILDVDLEDQSILLKPTAKRSNRTVYFDSEAKSALQKWLKNRERRQIVDNNALFISYSGKRLSNAAIDRIVLKAGERVGLHDAKAKKSENFTVHCARHFFTTCLIRSGMPRDFIKELRGDARREAIDIYNHIDKKELKESYLAHIPKLGL
jgi:integrase/recombinase XerD